MIRRANDEKSINKCEELFNKLILEERKYDDSISDKVEKRYDKNANLLCYERDGEIVGYLSYREIENNNKNGYLIDGLYVESKYRNQGIGTELVEEAVKIIEGSDADFIDINVLAANEIALKLYRSCSFGEFRIGFRKDL